MTLSVKGLTIACGLLWGGCVLGVGLLNVVSPPYGAEFLATVGSIYPGFHATGSFGDAVVGGLYALLDGAVCGALLAWLNNLAVGRPAAKST